MADSGPDGPHNVGASRGAALASYGVVEQQVPRDVVMPSARTSREGG
jgi:hypothetical protein